MVSLCSCHILHGLRKQHMAGKEHNGANEDPVLTCKRLSNSLKRYAGFRAKAEFEAAGKNMRKMSLL